MKTSIINETLYKTSLTHQEVAKRVKNIGFDGYDYTLYGEWATPQAIFSQPRENWVKFFEEERKIIEGEGLKVFQTHGTFRSDFDADAPYVFTQKVIDQFKREIEATAILGSKYIVIHPINLARLSKDKEKDFEINMTEFSKLTPILREFGVKNGIEDMFTWDPLRGRNCTTGCSTPEDMIRYIDGLNAPDAFCACLDTGHMLIHSIEPADAVRKLGSRLEILHVQDNNGITDQHLPVGLGITDWKDFVKALKDINYKGVFNLELTLTKFLNVGEKSLWKMVEYAFASAKEILGE